MKLRTPRETWRRYDLFCWWCHGDSGRCRDRGICTTAHCFRRGWSSIIIIESRKGKHKSARIFFVRPEWVPSLSPLVRPRPAVVIGLGLLGPGIFDFFECCCGSSRRTDEIRYSMGSLELWNRESGRGYCRSETLIKESGRHVALARSGSRIFPNCLLCKTEKTTTTTNNNN